MKKLFLNLFFLALSISCFSQELVKDSTYIVPINDSMFTMVTLKQYSNGVTQSSSTPVTPSEILSNITSFFNFKVREYVYSATGTYDSNRKVILIKNANQNLKDMANIDVLAGFAQANQSTIVGTYGLNGSTITLSFSDNTLNWAQGGNSGTVTVYGENMISLNGFFGGKDVLLYKNGHNWNNCDGLFTMTPQ